MKFKIRVRKENGEGSEWEEEYEREVGEERSVRGYGSQPVFNGDPVHFGKKIVEWFNKGAAPESRRVFVSASWGGEE